MSIEYEDFVAGLPDDTAIAGTETVTVQEAGGGLKKVSVGDLVVGATFPAQAAETFFGNPSTSSGTPTAIPQGSERVVRAGVGKLLAPMSVTEIRASGSSVPVGTIVELKDRGAGDLCDVVALGSYVDNDIDIFTTATRAFIRRVKGHFTPEMINCAGDGTTDDRAKFLALCTRAAATNTPKVKVSKLHAMATALILTSAHNGLTIEASNPAAHGFISTGTNQTIISLTGVDGAKIENVGFWGNDTGGKGIVFSDSRNVTIRDCYFDHIGKPTGAQFSVCIQGSNVTDTIVSGCFFDEHNRSTTGADVSLNDGCARSVVDGNISISDHDSFFSGAATSTEEGDTIAAVVSDNICIRPLTSTSRSGILAAYGRGVRATVNGNYIEGFGWNGMYVTQSSDFAESEGGIVAVGNNIYFCGGHPGLPEGSGSNGAISAGIFTSSELPVLLSSNVVYRQGFRADGTDRSTGSTYPTYGLRTSGRGIGKVVSNNIVMYCTGYGIGGGQRVGSPEPADLIALKVIGNLIYEFGMGSDGLECAGLYFEHSTGAATNTFGIDIENNRVMHSTDQHGLWARHYNPGSPAIRDLRINNNVFVCTHSSPTRYGLYESVASYAGETRANSWTGYAAGNWYEYSGVSRFFPESNRHDGNTYINCAIGIRTTTLSEVFLNAQFQGCAANFSGGGYNGRLIGNDASGHTLVEVYSTAQPTTGAGNVWYKGDRWLNTAHDLGTYAGATCTTANTTWSKFGMLFSPTEDLTISSGAVTWTKGKELRIDTEGGASTDDLLTISGVPAGEIIVVTALNATHDVVLKDVGGNFYLNGDCTLDHNTDTITFISNGTHLRELCRTSSA